MDWAELLGTSVGFAFTFFLLIKLFQGDYVLVILLVSGLSLVLLVLWILQHKRLKTQFRD
jgi:Flp pilus assembly protein TadB